MGPAVNGLEAVSVVDNQPEAKHITDKKAPKSSISIVNVALRVLEGIGLIFANIFTLGLINFLPGIHKEYSKVFGGKEVKVIESDESLDKSAQSDDENNVAGEDRPIDTEVVPTVNDAETEGEQPPVPQRDPVDGAPNNDDVDDEMPEHPCNKFAGSVTHYGSKARDGVVYVWNNANKENAERAWNDTKTGTSWAYNQTKSGTSWAAGHVKHGAQAAWQGANRENAAAVRDYAVQKSGELIDAAKKPENLRTTVGTIVGVAATAIGFGAYLYSGGDPSDVASGIICLATNGTAIPC